MSVGAIDIAVSGVKNGAITIIRSTAKDFQLTSRITRTSFEIKTDALSNTGKALADQYKRENKDNSRGPYLTGYTSYEFMGQNDNAIANDLYAGNHRQESGLEKLIDISLAAQIHETGVSLSRFFGEKPPPKKYKDRDSGSTVDDCVLKNLNK